ncbi:MAG: Ig domain-containing protein, partial [Paludibacteraceae bacterium]|nr:Ig domain-containing protein [Paludibacteraceae bacterium]
MTISAPTALTYDGTAKEASLSTDYNTTAFPGTYTIEYYNGTTKLDSAPVNAGTYTAKVTAGTGDGAAAASVDFTITPATVSVTDVTLDKTTASIEVGKTVTLTATVEPDNATDKTVTWTSSAESVATVDGNGKVTAVKAGTATITAKAGDKTATCTVTVTASSGGNSGGSSGGYTPSPSTYIPSTTTTTTTTNTSSFADKTEENNNYAGAEINMKSDELEKAILTDEDKKVIAAGGTVTVELEVEEKTPTAEEKKEVEAAVEAAKEASGEDYTVAMYFDANLFKTSNGTKTQLHETNGKIAVSFKLPAQFKNTDSSVTRTYAVASIH